MSYELAASAPRTTSTRREPLPDGFSVRPTNSDRIIRRLFFMVLVHVACQTAIPYLPVAWWPLAAVVPVSIVAATFVVCLHDAVRCLDRYTAKENHLVIETGFLSRRTRYVPLTDVREVTVKRTIFQRAFGFGTGDLVVRTGNETGSSEVGLSPIPGVAGLNLRRSNKRLETIVLRDVSDPFRHAEILLGRLRSGGDR